MTLAMRHLPGQHDQKSHGHGSPGMDWGQVIDLYGQSYDEAEAGDFTVAVFERGDFTLFFKDEHNRYESVRELDAEYANELAAALDDFADDAEAVDLGDDEESEDADDYVHIGESDALVGYTNGGQVIFSASKSGDYEPDLHVAGNAAADQFRVDPDTARDLADALRDMVERYDELNEQDAERSRKRGRRMAELRALIERHLPGEHNQESHGHGGTGGNGGQSANPGGLRDTLKLAGKIALAPNEKLIGSAKVDGDSGGIRMALTEQDGKRTLRLGLGGEGYGQRNRDTGTPAWDGNGGREPLSKEEYDRLDAEHDALDAQYDSASPARQAELQARMEEIREQLSAVDEGFHGTAKLDEYGMRRLADRIRPALEEAVAQAKRESKAWDEIEALEAEGNPDPDRMAELRRIARADDTDFITFDEGIIAGLDWGDVHFSVEMDESDPIVGLGVWPKGAPDDWGDGREWRGQFDAAETRKFLRLLDKTSPTAQRAYSPEQGSSAPASSAPKGGQFALGGGRVGAKAKQSARKRAPRRPAAPAGPLSFNGKFGTGYGIKGGDPRVRTLQSALNRLSLADSSGAALALDGRYGPRTTSAVKKLQKALGLPVDGKVTPELLKQVTELKQLPPKTPRKPRRTRTKPDSVGIRSASAHVLHNGICATCTASRSAHEHIFDNGTCRTCVA